jgi:hypothetical protein
MSRIERLKAICDAFDMIDDAATPRRDAEGRTVVEALAHEMLAHPLDAVLEILEDAEEHGDETTGSRTAGRGTWPERAGAAQKQALAEMFRRYIFILDRGKFYDLDEHEVMSGRAFEVDNVHIAPAGTTGRKTAKAIYLNDRRRRIIETTTFQPGAGLFVQKSCGGAAINLWREGLDEWREETSGSGLTIAENVRLRRDVMRLRNAREMARVGAAPLARKIWCICTGARENWCACEYVREARDTAKGGKR